MRFLLFNLAVGAAIFYLLTGNPGEAARNAGLPEAAVSTINSLSTQARKKVAATVEAPKSEKITPSAPAAKSPAPPPQVVEAKADAPKSAKPLPPVKEAEFVPTRPVHAAPRLTTETAKPAPLPKVAAASPAVSKRRAEVLGTKSSGSTPGAKPSEGLMSPRERYRELSKLVDDMELVYFNSLGN